MKLKNQVTSLELSNKLKKLGVKQESLFVYRYDEPMCVDTKYFGSTGKEDLHYIGEGKTPEGWKGRTTPAYTVAELGEMLLSDGCVDLPEWNEENADWSFQKVEHGWSMAGGRATTEANARAKMLIYLLENNLIEV